MKSLLLSVSCLSFLVLGCGQSQPESSNNAGLFDREAVCARASALPAGTDPSRFFFRTVAYDEFLKISDDPEVYSSYGMEVSREIRKSWDPLNGTGIVTRRHCTRAFVMENGQKKYLETDRVPGSHRPTAALANYNALLLEGFSGEGKEQTLSIVRLDTQSGQRQILAQEPAPLGACNAALRALVAPSDEHFLVERTQSDSCEMEEPAYDLSLQLYDAAGQQLNEAFAERVSRAYQLTWISATEYELIDADRSWRFTVPAL